jgi:hypothetical protein
VESTQRSESSPSIGGRIGNDPVATIACLNEISSPPSTRIVLASANVPVPLTHSTPLTLKSVAIPPVICLTTASFHSFAVGKCECETVGLLVPLGADAHHHPVSLACVQGTLLVAEPEASVADHTTLFEHHLVRVDEAERLHRRNRDADDAARHG